MADPAEEEPRKDHAPEPSPHQDNEAAAPVGAEPEELLDGEQLAELGEEEELEKEISAEQAAAQAGDGNEKIEIGPQRLQVTPLAPVEVVRVDKLHENTRSASMASLPFHERRVIPSKADIHGKRHAMTEVMIPTSARPQTGQSREAWIYSMIMKYYPSKRMEPFFFAALKSIIAAGKGNDGASRVFAAQGDPASGKSFTTRLLSAILTGIEDPNDYPQIDCTKFREAEELTADLQINSNPEVAAPAIVVDGELTTAFKTGAPPILDEVNHIQKTGALHGITEMMSGSIGRITINAADNVKLSVHRDDLPPNFFMFMSGNKVGQGNALPFPEPVISRLGQGIGFYNIADADAKSFATAFAGQYMGMRAVQPLLDLYGEDNMRDNPQGFFRILESVLQEIYYGEELPEEIYWRADQWQRSVDGCNRVGELLYDLKVCFSSDGLEQILGEVSESLDIDDQEIRRFQAKVSKQLQDLKPEIDERIIPKIFDIITDKSTQTQKPPTELHREGHVDDFNSLRVYDNDPVNDFGTLLYHSVREWLDSTIVEPMALEGNEVEYMTKLIDTLMQRSGLHPSVENSVVAALNIDVTALELSKSAQEIQANAFAMHQKQFPGTESTAEELFPVAELIDDLSGGSRMEKTKIVSIPLHGDNVGAVVGSHIVQTYKPEGGDYVKQSVDPKAFMDIRQFLLTLSMPGIGNANLDSITEVAKFGVTDFENLSESEQLRLGVHPSGISVISASTLLKLKGQDYRADVKIMTNRNTGGTILVLPENAPKDLILPAELEEALRTRKVSVFVAGEKTSAAELRNQIFGERLEAAQDTEEEIKTAFSLGFDTSGIEREQSGNLKIPLEELMLTSLPAENTSMLLSHGFQIETEHEVEQEPDLRSV